MPHPSDPARSAAAPASRAPRRRWPLPAAVAGVALAVTLTGCNGYTATYPKQARTAGADGGAAAFATDATGPVDCRKAKCVALTFDTGPSRYTAGILASLRQYHAHATFFVRGDNTIKYAVVARQTVAEGNEIETITYDHGILTKLNKAEVRSEIVRGQDAVQKITGVRPMLLRPPQGRTSSDVTSVVKSLGMAEVVWNDTASDYKTNDTKLIAQRIVDQAKPDGILLLHDHYDPTHTGYNGTAAAVPLILAQLEQKGYVFVTVQQLLAPGKPQPGKVYK